tara:strand:+ start:609 stop:1262 length:654 start_codon:yes stop_codon:yes gene_type:complete
MTNNWLISYPKSGSNFIRYCIEFLTHLPTCGPTKLYEITPSTPLILDRAHTIDERVANLHSTANLCFLLRDYKELYYRPDMPRPWRNRVVFNSEGCQKLNNISSTLNSYFELYERHQGKKKILYYEDILTDIEPIEDLVTNFYDCKLKEDIEEFKKRIDYHRCQSLSVLGNPRFSDAVSADFFQQDVPMQELQNLRDAFEKELGTNYKFVERYRIGV